MDLSWCTTHSQDWKETGTCYLEFAKCLKDGGPTPVTYAPELAAAKMDDQPTRGQFAVYFSLRQLEGFSLGGGGGGDKCQFS